MDIYRIDKERAIYDSDLIASYARMDGELDEWIGALVLVEPCEHGKIDSHRTAPPGYQHGNEPERCPGAGIGA